MRIHPPLFPAIILGTLLLLASLPSSTLAAADWELPSGHHFTQAGDYTVVDDAQAGFWTEFQRQGGVARIGY
ncbi:MAG TPA: hypothetical protein VHS06_05020, partial [Chloroflexota bacterium]|nr:hypothetical protein [Chloroflexota bacterium]